jgi:predicted acyl esterase
VLLTRILTALATPLAAAGTLLAPAQAGAASFTSRDVTLTARDGVKLAATVFVPQAPAPARGYPALVLLHGWGEDRSSMQPLADLFATHGYVVLTYDQRGWGRSGGRVDSDGPATIGDARDAVAWLGRDTGLEGPKPPRVDWRAIGMSGVSYGGGTTLLAAEHGAKVAAIAPIIGWSDVEAALVPGGVIKTGYVLGLLHLCRRCDSFLSRLYRAAVTRRDTRLLASLTRPRSPIFDVAAIHVPTFLLQGRRDALFPPEQMIDLYERLRVPKRLYIGLLGHAPANDPAREVPHYTGELLAWFDHYLRGVDNGVQNLAPVEYAADPDPVTPFLTSAHFDPRLDTSFDGVERSGRSVTYYLHAGGALSDAPPAVEEPPDTIHAPDPRLAADPGQGVAYTLGAPLARGLVIRGRPRLTLPLASSDGYTHVVCELWWTKGARNALLGFGARYLAPARTATPEKMAVYFQYVVGEVPPGALLRLVVEGGTNRVYSSWFARYLPLQDPAGTRLVIAHSAATPASLTLPLAAPDQAPRVGRVQVVGLGLTRRLSARTHGAHRLSWSFGDGTPLRAGMHVTHRYSAPGRYAGTLTAYSAGGEATNVRFSVLVR